MSIKPQDTYNLMGCGQFVYPWYWGVKDPYADIVDLATLPDDWQVSVRMSELDKDGGEVEVKIDHKKILWAMTGISLGLVHGYNDETARLVNRYLKDPQPGDFDAPSADEVTQVAIFGKVIYG